ncbi:hypothetical protein NJC40_11170 [Pseudomonas sp. 21LCFQ02]|uniref:hypothetical protein n=1 Tax=Pseudomonas sp. 21LCFQ02 TaxID=2957505 RepID=UPI00209A6456|nr:hypothetical protein [Pseudomonas sp. 21LCFQ02]MCO8168336.1 hypothetical protein [Pseudomonas sp. 21LCFQ02]
MRCALALTLLCLPAVASADCTAQLAGWAKKLHPDLTFSAQHSVCKASPVDAKRTLAALAFVESGDEEDGATYGLEVLTAVGGQIEQHVYESAAISSDAVRFESLSLDTARYHLTPELRAFGVRASYVGSSRVNPFSSTDLSLYVLDGAKPRKVLDKLEVQRSGGEWDGNCQGEFYDITSSLAIDKTLSHGYAGLAVTEKTVESRSFAKHDDCSNSESKPVTKRYLVTYDGTHYVVPGQGKHQ